MKIKEIETQAPTVEEAIQEGLEQLQVEKNKVDVRILDEGSKGLFGLMGAKPAIVHLKIKQGTEMRSSSVESGALSSERDIEQAQQKAKNIAEHLLNLMDIKDHQLKVSIKDRAVYLEITTPESSILIGEQGKTLQALQFILTLMIAKEKNTRFSVYVDINGYRGEYEERLVRLAKQAAEEVKRSKKVKQFDPMPSIDRRIIHLALQDDAGVITESKGDGIFRKVLVKPKIT